MKRGGRSASQFVISNYDNDYERIKQWTLQSPPGLLSSRVAIAIVEDGQQPVGQ